MTKFLKTVMISACICLIGVAGCSKKVTKVEPIPEPTPPPPAYVEPPPPPPPPVEEFIPIDMDALLRQALSTIYFAFDKYDLRPDAISSLEQIARFLQEHNTVRLLAEGHCDERGSSEYNMGLGENRSRAVKKYLVSYGISADRLETTSYGKERLARQDCGSDESCNQTNRRVEWQVLAK